MDKLKRATFTCSKGKWRISPSKHFCFTTNYLEKMAPVCRIVKKVKTTYLVVLEELRSLHFESWSEKVASYVKWQRVEMDCFYNFKAFQLHNIIQNLFKFELTNFNNRSLKKKAKILFTDRIDTNLLLFSNLYELSKHVFFHLSIFTKGIEISSYTISFSPTF